ncbi:hypothetical protein RND81_08G077600 [Saponaria officinalis]|uniref:Uncharacterized protein n=1 Tax=Saponaria officinalis TaxID=3572 RepID=A0AAW1J4J3_SAPOF
MRLGHPNPSSTYPFTSSFTSSFTFSLHFRFSVKTGISTPNLNPSSLSPKTDHNIIIITDYHHLRFSSPYLAVDFHASRRLCSSALSPPVSASPLIFQPPLSM